MYDTPYTFLDIRDRGKPVDAAGRLIVETSAPGQVGDVLFGAYADDQTVEGATIALDWAQVNTLHEHLGRLLLESGVTRRSPMGVESEAVKELREARDLLREAFLAFAGGPGAPATNATAIKIAKHLLRTTA